MFIVAACPAGMMILTFAMVVSDDVSTKMVVQVLALVVPAKVPPVEQL